MHATKPRALTTFAPCVAETDFTAARGKAFGHQFDQAHGHEGDERDPCVDPGI